MEFEISGTSGRSYGYRKPRFDRSLKAVYKTVALCVLRGDNSLREYYEYLRTNGIAEHNARHALARKIAAISYGILKNESVYQECISRERNQYPISCKTIVLISFERWWILTIGDVL